MLPVAGSPAGAAHAIRRGGTSLSYTLIRCSQICLPVFASRHSTRSCIDSPSPAVLNRYTRPFITIGDERPPKGAFHTRFSPLGDHLVGSPFSDEVPSRAGPRQSGQSLADAPRSAGAKVMSRRSDRYAIMPGFIVSLSCNGCHWSRTG